MPVEPTHATRPSLMLRVDMPEVEPDWFATIARPAIVVLGAAFVIFGGADQELGPGDARLGLASGEPIGPFGRAFGYWDPSLWPIPVALGRLVAWFEEVGPTQGVVRWPAAIAAVIAGIILARRVRLKLGPRAGLIAAFAWFGSVAMMDRSSGLGLDLIPGLGVVAALDRLLAKGSGWSVGAWAALVFLSGGWPPLAVLGLATVVLGRSGATWSWSMTVPVAVAVVGWSAWALSAAPPAALATALTLPITRGSEWGLAALVVAAGCPFAPFAALALSKKVREGLPEAGRTLTVGWLQVAGACLIVGTVVPGLASAAMVPALAGLAVASAACWDRAWSDDGSMPAWVRRCLFGLTLLITGAWLVTVLSVGGPMGFRVGYYRAVIVVVAIASLTAFIFAIEAARRSDGRRGLIALAIVAASLKLAHWGCYVPESNYREGMGPWGRAIGQWVPEKLPVYVLHSWSPDLAFAIGRPVRQLPAPQNIEWQPGKGAKFVLLTDIEYQEYQGWSQGWPKLIEVAKFEDETGIHTRHLTRTEGPVIYERPYRKAAPE